MNIVISLSILFLAQLCVGANFVLSKGLISHINPLVILLVRFSVASVFMYAMIKVERKQQLSSFCQLSKKEILILCTQGLAAGIFFNILVLIGLYYTSANSAGLITSLLPAVVILMNVIFFSYKLSKKIIIALCISVMGLILINLSPIEMGVKNALLGNFLIFIALIPDALYYVLSKQYNIKISTNIKTFIFNAVNVPFLILIIIFYPSANFDNISLIEYGKMSLIGITSGLFFVLWELGSKKIDATFSALAIAFMPIATVILAVIVLNEQIGFIKFIGMILVIISIISYSKK